ncbi:MAG: zinc-binding dehydrogenase [Planctomycetes bacterium]|nr:zinc-binding dehydrogenase [Planctomycetota bacterium]
MHAAVITGPGQTAIERHPDPVPGPRQVRVRVEGCGVCASNVPPFEGRPWFRYPLEPGGPGHEGWGVVEAVGAEVRGPAPGDRVAFLSGRAYATHDLAEADQCVVLPQSLAGPFPGEALACAMNIFARAEVRPDHTVAIVGGGFLGLALTALCSRARARVLVVSRRASSLRLARRLGADQAVLLDDLERAADVVRQATGGEGCERVIEAVGKQTALDLATRLTRVRGRLVIAGYHQDGARQVDMQLWNWRGLDVVNAHERDPAVYVAGMRAAVDAVADGTLDLEALLTHALPLERLGDALALAATSPEGFVKAWVYPGR